jgi:hypothetical protein
MMAVTVASSRTVSSDVRDTYTRYVYEYTLSNGEVYQERAGLPTGVDADAERVARGQRVLDSLVTRELTELLEGA